MSRPVQTGAFEAAPSLLNTVNDQKALDVSVLGEENSSEIREPTF